jgi:hypothetical protein
VTASLTLSRVFSKAGRRVSLLSFVLVIPGRERKPAKLVCLRHSGARVLLANPESRHKRIRLWIPGSHATHAPRNDAVGFMLSRFQTASESGKSDLQTSIFVSAMPFGPDYRQHFRSRNQSALGVYPIRAKKRGRKS